MRSSRSSGTSGSPGEVANLRRQASGHVYFSLKDDEAVIGAVLWATQARRLKFRLDEGQEVLARGFVEIYPPHGKYQLVVQEVEPRGAGALALLLQQIKERLQAEGLLDPARKRAAAVHPAAGRRRDEPHRRRAPRLPARAPRPVPAGARPRRAVPGPGRGRGGDGDLGDARALPGGVRRGGGHARGRLAGGPRRLQRRAAGAGHRGLPGAGRLRGGARGGLHRRGPRRRRPRRHAHPRGAARRAGPGRARRVAPAALRGPRRAGAGGRAGGAPARGAGAARPS